MIVMLKSSSLKSIHHRARRKPRPHDLLYDDFLFITKSPKLGLHVSTEYPVDSITCRFTWEMLIFNTLTYPLHIDIIEVITTGIIRWFLTSTRISGHFTEIEVFEYNYSA